MAEGGCPADADPPAKVRLVRCPKCEKLLPELDGFTVYRCGGCSATLQALTPRQEVPGDASSEKLEEQMERESRDAQMLVSEVENPPNASSVCAAEARAGDNVLKEKLEANGGHPSRTSASNIREGRPEDGDRRSRSHLRPSKAPVGNYFSSVDDNYVSRGKNLHLGNGGEMHQVLQNGALKRGSGEIVTGIQSSPRASLQGVRLVPNPNEGGSLNLPPRRKDGNRVAYRNPGLPDGVENLENDRVELLRKLDELREQLSQSCKVADGSKDRPPANTACQNLYSDCFRDQRGFQDQDGWFGGGMSSTVNQPPASHSSFASRDHSLHLQNYGPALHSQNEMLGCGMPFGSRMSRVAPCDPYGFCHQRGSPNIASSQFDQDLLMPYPHGGYYHQPACSCSHFCNQHWRGPSHVPVSTLENRWDAYHSSNGHGFYPVNGSLGLDVDGLNRGAVNSSTISGNPIHCQRLPFGNFKGRDCRPLAGGAPFVACCNCSELLQLPQKQLLMGKGQYKLRCGSCSHVISVELDKDGVIASQPVISMSLESARVNDRRNQILVDSYYAGDYDRPGFNLRSAEEKVVLSSYPPLPLTMNDAMNKEDGMNLGEAENMEGRSSSSSVSRGERSPDALLQQRDASSSRELQKPDVNSRASGLPLREHFGYSPSSIVANRSGGTGSRSKRSDQEKMVSVSGAFKQNSVKDVAVATEMDLLVDEYPHPRLSEDSDEASKEDEHPRATKGGESFLTGFIKKSFKDLSRPTQHGENRKFKVSINGHPLPDRVVKKAEKLAGPIQPGEYWYDHQAGFWGVMGQHCLGIIPPFIEELNYPLSRNCAGGDTGVLVNGRELHQKDLDLLASRGLPITKNRSYLVDISGKVSDAVSGEELDGLGKLAPTVEKMKHGFGMRVFKEASE